MASNIPQENSIELANLTAQQLSSVKKQLDSEIEHLTTSYTKLLAAQSRFRECLKSIKQGISLSAMGKPILIPMTSSLYVPGTLADPDKVIVDIGTGFYTEMNTKDATRFYEGKVEDLAMNLKDLESIVQNKSNNLRVVEDALRHKMANAPSISPTT